MTRTFSLGFGISVALLGACTWFTFESTSRASVLATFDLALRGWQVHQPLAYEICILLFATLNVPAIVATWITMKVLDSLVALPPEVRAAAAFATSGVGSAIWWRFLARWKTRRDSSIVSGRTNGRSATHWR